MDENKGVVRAMFAVVLLILAGVMNIVYGLAAIDGAAYFNHPTHFLFGTLQTWGWIALVVGVLELAAAGSLFAGQAFGRYVGIAVGACAAVSALLDIQAAPLWSLAVFALSIWIIHGIATYHESERTRSKTGSAAGSTTLLIGPRPPM
ncbi:MAG TPA: hypothetical protein VJ741_12880 [Solirubrobacteraceae bacterium]|nr:hypothetical protein [Solirubrobacteraceae bacterium]